MEKKDKNENIKKECKKVNTKEKIKFKDKLSDTITSIYGSWFFILFQTSFIAIWIIWNKLPTLHSFDPSPFILLNLILSIIAGCTGSLLQISANRQKERDRIIMEEESLINLRAEEIMHTIKDDVYHIKNEIIELNENLDEIEEIKDDIDNIKNKINKFKGESLD